MFIADMFLATTRLTWQRRFAQQVSNLGISPCGDRAAAQQISNQPERVPVAYRGRCSDAFRKKHMPEHQPVIAQAGRSFEEWKQHPCTR